MKQPKSLQASIYKACSELYICKLSKMGFYYILHEMQVFLPHLVN